MNAIISGGLRVIGVLLAAVILTLAAAFYLHANCNL